MTAKTRTLYVHKRSIKNKLKAFTSNFVKTACLLLVLPLLIMGCEASLNIEKINQELQKKVRRTDQFQGVASNGSHLVSVGADGSNALVLTSLSKKLDWTRQIISEQSTLIDVVACPDKSFIALGTDKKIWHSKDNGMSWQAYELSTQEDILAINCGHDNSIWAVGSFATIIASMDQGKTWNTNSLNEDAMLTGIFFLGTKTVIVVGEFGLISRSDDGGLNWNPPEYIPNDFYIQDAYFATQQQGWVGGLSGQILYTADGGLNWTQQNTPTDSPIYGFYKTANKLYAFGDHSTLLEFDGNVWLRSTPPGKPVYLRDAILLNDGKLLLVGGSGSLYAQQVERVGRLAGNKK